MTGQMLAGPVVISKHRHRLPHAHGYAVHLTIIQRCQLYCNKTGGETHSQNMQTLLLFLQWIASQQVNIYKITILFNHKSNSFLAYKANLTSNSMYPLIYFLGNSITFSLSPCNLYASKKVLFLNSQIHYSMALLSVWLCQEHTNRAASCILTSAHNIHWSLKKNSPTQTTTHNPTPSRLS